MYFILVTVTEINHLAIESIKWIVQNLAVPSKRYKVVGDICTYLLTHMKMHIINIVYVFLKSYNINMFFQSNLSSRTFCWFPNLWYDF